MSFVISSMYRQNTTQNFSFLIDTLVNICLPNMPHPILCPWDKMPERKDSFNKNAEDTIGHQLDAKLQVETGKLKDFLVFLCRELTNTQLL